MHQHSLEVSPEVTLLNHQQSQVVGKTTILTCKIRGFPLGSTFWSKDGFQINDNNSSSPKYKYEFYDVSNFNQVCAASRQLHDLMS